MSAVMHKTSAPRFGNTSKASESNSTKPSNTWLYHAQNTTKHTTSTASIPVWSVSSSSAEKHSNRSMHSIHSLFPESFSCSHRTDECRAIIPYALPLQSASGGRGHCPANAGTRDRWERSARSRRSPLAGCQQTGILEIVRQYTSKDSCPQYSKLCEPK